MVRIFCIFAEKSCVCIISRLTTERIYPFIYMKKINYKEMKSNSFYLIQGRWMFTLMLTAVFSIQAVAQGFQREIFPEGSYSPVTNVNRNSYPRVLSDNSVMFRVNAPQAQNVQIDLCGTKYDMVKSEGGVWMVTTKPQVPGFHYYFLIIDGVSTADPASQTFYGCGRWSSAIEILEAGMERWM